MLKFCNKKERNLQGDRHGGSQQKPELSCCPAQPEAMAALHRGSRSSTDGCKGAAGQGRDAGKNAPCIPAAGALRKANLVPFILVLVVKVFKTNTNAQLPPAPSPWRTCQEVAFSPPAEEPLEEPTVGLRWLGRVEHLAVPALD